MTKYFLYSPILITCIFSINLYAEPRANNSTPLEASKNQVSAKVAVPVTINSKNSIPNLVKNNTSPPYTGGNLAIIENNTSNKPLPLKKYKDIKKAKKTSENNIHVNIEREPQKQAGSLKIIENGQSTFDNFDNKILNNNKYNEDAILSSSENSTLSTNSNTLNTANKLLPLEVKNKASIENNNLNTQHVKLNNKSITNINSLNTNSNIDNNLLKELYREIILLRQEIQEIKQKNK